MNEANENSCVYIFILLDLCVSFNLLTLIQSKMLFLPKKELIKISQKPNVDRILDKYPKNFLNVLLPEM